MVAAVRGAIGLLIVAVTSTLCTSAASAQTTPAFTKLDTAVGDYPRAVAVGDFNGDGRPDLAVANYLSDTVSIRLGDGTGRFTSAPDLPVTNSVYRANPVAVTVGDFNNDAKADLAVAVQSADKVSVFLGDGAGNFRAAADVAVGNAPASVAVGDFNQDGTDDLVVANFEGDAQRELGSLHIRLGNGDGTFRSGFPKWDGISRPRSLAVADFNGDAKDDVLVANYSTNNINVRLGQGDGQLSGPNYANARVGTNPVSVAVGDFNGDGRPDFAAANAGSNDVTVRLGDFGVVDTYAWIDRSAVPVNQPTAVAVGDLNGDGRVDLAITSAASNAVVVRLGGGNGYFSTAPDAPVGATPSALAVADFDGDFQTDLATANQGSDTVSVLVNQRLRATQAALTVTSTAGTYPTPLPLTTSGGSTGGPVTYTATNGTATGCSVSGGAPYTLSSTSAGSCTVTATMAGNATYEPVSSAPTPVTFAASTPALRINDVMVTEGNSGTIPATFTITRTGNTSGTSSVTWATANNTAVAGTDFVGVAPTSVSFGPGETTKTVSVTVNGDSVGEPNESFVATLSAPVGATVADGSGTGTIVNDDTSLSINDVTVAEGNSGTVPASFTITRAGATGTSSTVQWATANGTATAGSDYVGVAPTTVSFAAGETTKAVSVTVNGDTQAEGDELFSVNLSSPVGATISDGSGAGRITNDDTYLAINDVAVAEGNSGTKLATFTIRRLGPTGTSSSVQWATANSTAIAGTDYVAVAATTVTFAPGETTKPVSVTVNGDTLAEANEAFLVKLSAPVGAVIQDGTGQGTISNDDIGLAINNVTVTEGNAGTKLATFTVTLSPAANAAVSVQWATANSTATAGTDFVAVAPTTITFAAGQTTKTVTVTVNGDTQGEANETFFVRLSAPVGATLMDDTGLGTITNDDTALVINNVTVTEGNAGTTPATFTVTRSGPTGGTSSVTWATANSNAAAGSDYVAVPATTLTFAAGETTKTVTVTVNGDTQGEANELFIVRLSSAVGATILDDTGVGTITNDDTALAVGNVTVTEGHSGTKSATFTVTRSGPTGASSSVTWATANATATAGTDYVAVPATTLTFAPGETPKTVSVVVNGDSEVEPNETFSVRLSSPVGATLLDDLGVGTITNDDTAVASGAVAPPAEEEVVTESGSHVDG